ncbi:MAG: hemerythrin domain-containing protein [Bacteroidota bacterium]
MKGTSSDLIQQTIDRRFEQNASITDQASPIERDFYMDLLCVFHDPKKFEAEDFMKYSIQTLLTYLKQTHQFYLSKNLADLEYAVESMAERDTSLAPLQEHFLTFFRKFRKKLEDHINEEELHLFPYLEALSEASANGTLRYSATSKMQLVDFLLHHSDDLEQEISSIVKKLRLVIETKKGSFGLKLLTTKLSIFETDLRIHGQIEDDVLMPKALQLEKDILQSANIRLKD